MNRKPRGFTLIELMVVVALAAILAALAAPSFKSFVSGQRVKAAASDFAMGSEKVDAVASSGISFSLGFNLTTGLYRRHVFRTGIGHHL